MDSDIIKLNNVNFYYGPSQALTDISMNFVKNKVTALIGPTLAVTSWLVTLALGLGPLK